MPDDTLAEVMLEIAVAAAKLAECLLELTSDVLAVGERCGARHDALVAAATEPEDQ